MTVSTAGASSAGGGCGGPNTAISRAATTGSLVLLRYFRHDGAKLQALARSALLIIARPPSALTATSDRLVSNTRRRIDGSVSLAMRGIESIWEGPSSWL
jgi:hypothetical protein